MAPRQSSGLPPGPLREGTSRDQRGLRCIWADGVAGLGLESRGGLWVPSMGVVSHGGGGDLWGQLLFAEPQGGPGGGLGSVAGVEGHSSPPGQVPALGCACRATGSGIGAHGGCWACCLGELTCDAGDLFRNGVGPVGGACHAIIPVAGTETCPWLPEMRPRPGTASGAAGESRAAGCGGSPGAGGQAPRRPRRSARPSLPPALCPPRTHRAWRRPQRRQ